MNNGNQTVPWCRSLARFFAAVSADETGVPIPGVKCDSPATYACHSQRLSLSLSLTQ